MTVGIEEFDIHLGRTPGMDSRITLSPVEATLFSGINICIKYSVCYRVIMLYEPVMLSVQT